MNNWRLLLLAVIAVIQPVPSFTDNALIDGRRECCDHRFNSIAPDIRLYGTFRKTSSDNRRLDTRAIIFEERRSKVRVDTTTRSNELATERSDNSLSESTRSSIGSRLARDQNRRFSDTFETRDEGNLRHRDSLFRSSSQYERNSLDSRRIRISEDRRLMGKERLNRDFQGPVEVRRERGTAEVYRQERGFVSRDADLVRRNFKIGRDNIRGYYIIDGRVKINENSNRYSRSPNSREYANNMPEVFSSKSDSRERRESNIRIVSDRIDERRQGDGEPSDRMIHRDASQQFLKDHRQTMHDVVKQINRLGSPVREHQRGELGRSYERSSAALGSNERILNERREMFSLERRNDIRPSSQSSDRVSVSRESREDRTLEHESTNTRRIPVTERSIRNEPFFRYSTEETIYESRRKRENYIARDRNPLQLRMSRTTAERREEFSNPMSFSHNLIRTDRESRVAIDEKINRVSRELSINRMACNNERRQDRESTRVLQPVRISGDQENIRNIESFDRRREVRERNGDRIAAQRHDRYMVATRERYAHLTSRDTAKDYRVPHSRSFEDTRHNARRERDVIQESRILVEEQRQETRRIARSLRFEIQSELTRNRGDLRMTEKLVTKQDDERTIRDGNFFRRQTRDILDARSMTERKTQDGSSRDRAFNNLNERLSNNRDNTRSNERLIQDERDFSTSINRESRRVVNREIRANKPALSLDREINSLRRNIRMPAKLRSRVLYLEQRAISKDPRSEARIAKRESPELRFRNLESARHREIDVEEDGNEKATNWKMAFYTLQAAYLCVLIIKMLTENSNKGKTRYVTWWMSRKNLVKAD